MFQVDGKKQWWFIDPCDTFLGYPMVIFGRAAGFLMCLWPNQYNEEAFPLFKYCPVYTTVLEPGDVRTIITDYLLFISTLGCAIYSFLKNILHYAVLLYGWYFYVFHIATLLQP